MSDPTKPTFVTEATADKILGTKWRRTITLMTSCPAARDKSKLIELIESLPNDVQIVEFKSRCFREVDIVLESAEWKSTADKPLEVYTCRQVLR